MEVQDKIARSLLLIESESRVYGLFTWMDKKSDGWEILLDKTFAFDCGVNSAHLPETVAVSGIKFARNRFMHDAEIGIDESRFAKWIALHPMIVRFANPDQNYAGIMQLKWLNAIGSDNDFVDIIKMEIWSIPAL